MSQQNPDQTRADIEATRARLNGGVDAVAEKVTPEKVVDRQKSKARHKIQDVRESLMGSAEDARETGRDLLDEASHRMDQAGEVINNAPVASRAKTRGDPMAAGLIALGAGWLIGSLLPSSQKEQELVAGAADRVQPRLQSAMESTKEAAQEITDDLKKPAHKAVESVKQTAQSGAQEVKEQGQQEADQLKGSAQEHAKNLKDDTQRA